AAPSSASPRTTMPIAYAPPRQSNAHGSSSSNDRTSTHTSMAPPIPAPPPHEQAPPTPADAAEEPREIGLDRGRIREHAGVHERRQHCERYARADLACRLYDATSSSGTASGTPSRHSTTGTPACSYRARSASRVRHHSRYETSANSPLPGSTNGIGETSIPARAKPRARRSSSAAAERGSSSGVSASTSAFGGSV